MAGAGIPKKHGERALSFQPIASRKYLAVPGRRGGIPSAAQLSGDDSEGGAHPDVGVVGISEGSVKVRDRDPLDSWATTRQTNIRSTFFGARPKSDKCFRCYNKSRDDKGTRDNCQERS